MKPPPGRGRGTKNINALCHFVSDGALNVSVLMRDPRLGGLSRLGLLVLVILHVNTAAKLLTVGAKMPTPKRFQRFSFFYV